MVVDCEECGEHKFATRYKDSHMSFCRNCGYYVEYMGKGRSTDGFLDDEEFEELKNKYPIDLNPKDDY